MQKNINIIGCGYIGKKVAEKLSAYNVLLHGFVKSELSKKVCSEAGVTVSRIDLDNTSVNLNTEHSARFANSHIAYFVPPTPKGEVDTRMASFISALNGLPKAPEKIILISTTGVYGDCKGQWIDETFVTRPQAARAHRRLSAETQLTQYCENNKVELIIFRVPGIYAADKLPLKRIASGEPIVRAEDSGYTNRIHAIDLADFCVEALLEDVEAGVYNCCDGAPSTMHDYFTQVADAMNMPRPGEISLQQAQKELSAGMLSYLAESKRISNKKLLTHFKTRLAFPDLEAGLKNLK